MTTWVIIISCLLCSLVGFLAGSAITYKMLRALIADVISKVLEGLTDD